MSTDSKQIKDRNNNVICIGSYTYNQLNQLGSGYQSVVYKATHCSKKFDVALKIIQISKINQSINLNLLNSQLKCLEIFQGKPNILNMLEIIKTDKFIYVVTELCKGDLGGRKQKKLPEKQAWSFIKQMIKGYQHLYQKGIVHRDLKPQNMFIHEIGKIKIGDFGFAAPLEEVQRQTNYNIGSPSYMAPQVLHKNQYSHASDIWSIGDVPWSCESQAQIMQQITLESISKKIQNAKITHRSKYFLSQTLCFQPQLRIKPEELFLFDLFDHHHKIVQNQVNNSNNSTFQQSTTQPPKTQQIEIPQTPPMLRTKNSFKSNLTMIQFDQLTNQIFKKQQIKKNNKNNSDKHRKMSGDSTLQLSQKYLQQSIINQQQLSAKAKASEITQPSLNSSNGSNPTFKKNKKDIQQQQKMHLNIEQLDKIIINYLQCCKLIYKFIQLYNPNKIHSTISHQLKIFTHHLKNFIIKIMQNIQNIQQSSFLHSIISQQLIENYLSSHHFDKTNSIYLNTKSIFQNNQQFKKHWSFAKQQKPKIILNSAFNLLNTIKTLLITQNNNQHLCQICEYTFKIIQIFNNILKHKYISIQIIPNSLKIRKKIINNQYILKKIGEMQKFK